jgi:hypothetical protein
VARIAAHAKVESIEMKTEVFVDKGSWYRYALEQLLQVQRLAIELEMQDCLHLWPDQELKNKVQFMGMRKNIWDSPDLSEAQRIDRGKQDRVYYDTLYLPWLESWWSRISEWPGKERSNKWTVP